MKGSGPEFWTIFSTHDIATGRGTPEHTGLHVMMRYRIPDRVSVYRERPSSSRRTRHNNAHLSITHRATSEQSVIHLAPIEPHGVLLGTLEHTGLQVLMRYRIPDRVSVYRERPKAAGVHGTIMRTFLSITHRALMSTTDRASQSHCENYSLFAKDKNAVLSTTRTHTYVELWYLTNT